MYIYASNGGFKIDLHFVCPCQGLTSPSHSNIIRVLLAFLQVTIVILEQLTNKMKVTISYSTGAWSLTNIEVGKEGLSISFEGYDLHVLQGWEQFTRIMEKTHKWVTETGCNVWLVSKTACAIWHKCTARVGIMEIEQMGFGLVTGPDPMFQTSFELL